MDFAGEHALTLRSQTCSMPTIFTRILLFSIVLIGISCRGYQYVKYSTSHIATVDNNVCKKLEGEVVLYAIFVDSRYTHPWSEYDIRSTLDSINVAKEWLEQQAAAAGVELNIHVKYHQNGTRIPIAQNVSYRSLSGMLYTPTVQLGVQQTDRWANNVARTAGLSFPKDTSRIIKTPNRITDRERLIAKLRDMHGTDNVALMYFLNDYYREEISVAIHTGSRKEPEYAIVSFKKPAVIAHEFLHLFGALDLYMGPFSRKKPSPKKTARVMKQFPREVMAFTYRRLDSLEISPFTQYLIGWKSEMDEAARKSLLGRKIKVAKY